MRKTHENRGIKVAVTGRMLKVSTDLGKQGQQLKQRQKDVGRANTSKERVCKKPLAAKESQAITAAVFLLPIPCAFLDGPPSLRTS